MNELAGGNLDFDEVTTLLERVKVAIYHTVAHFEIEAWRTGEPVPFRERESGEYVRVKLGEPWASALFDCAWMRFSARIPHRIDGRKLVARIDISGEACVVDCNGTPVRGLTCIKSTFDPKLGGPGKTIYELPLETLDTGLVELWLDAGLNDLFGFLKDEGRVVLAEISLVREDLRQLYYDLETLRDWLVILPEGEWAVRLGEDFAVVAEELDCADAASVARARDRLAAWFDRGESAERFRHCPAVPLRVHAIGHAHLDLAWLWPIRETIRKGARTFASALYNIERYPEYVFGMSQPQLYAWMKEHQPELYVRIKEAVRAGRIEPQGTFWVEPDCSMPSGEAFVRQVLHGARFFREEFGIVPRYCWQPDVFGYHGQLPQILKKSGHDFFMTQKLSWNVVNRFGHHSFHWEGIDGTRILTHMLPEETYNGPAAARSLRKIADEYAEKDVSNHALMAFGIGDGGGGPDAEHLERLRRAPKLPGLPAVKVGTVSEFFETWSRDANQFPVWRGELYLERHQGTLTTQALVKRNNRRAEVALRELEWAAWLAAVGADIAYPAQALDRIWKEVLLYQFHDILPGSSIKRVYDECNARYAAILGELADLTHVRYQAVASLVASNGSRVVFNSLSWPRSEWLKIGDGWAHATIPAMGWALIGHETFDGRGGCEAEERRLENKNLRVIFAEDGRIVSLFDKKRCREVLAAGEFANDLVVLPDTGDAWDFEIDHGRKDVWGYLRGQIERPNLQAARAYVDGPCAVLEQEWVFRDSVIRQSIRLMYGAEQLEFDSQVDWREPAMMLRVRFPVAVSADEASFEIPFGNIRRSTKEDTPHRKAQIEVAALQWADLSQTDHGVALYNDCKHGFRIKGHVIDMALLRSVPHPGAALIGKEDVSVANGAVYTDIGSHVFRYALRPHGPEIGAAQLTAEARIFNTPLSIALSDGNPVVTRQIEPMPADSQAIEIVAVKPAENGNGWIMRLLNLTSETVATRLRVPGLVAGCCECDLMERPIGAAMDCGRHVPLVFSGFEIKTFHFTCNE